MEQASAYNRLVPVRIVISLKGHGHRTERQKMYNVSRYKGNTWNRLLFSDNSVPFARSTSRIQMLQAPSHMKSCVEDEALEDLHRKGGGGNHVHSLLFF